MAQSAFKYFSLGTRFSMEMTDARGSVS
jgi:hypothetical protein